MKSSILFNTLKILTDMAFFKKLKIDLEKHHSNETNQFLRMRKTKIFEIIGCIRVALYDR